MTAGSTRRVAGPLLAVAVFVLALGVWEAWASRHGSYRLPEMHSVARTAWNEWRSAEFVDATESSLKRLAGGLALGSVVGVALGLALGASSLARRTFEPLFDFVRAIPPVAFAPALIVILGLGDATRVALIAFGVVVPIVIHTADGVRAVSPEARDTATMLHVSPVGRVFRLYLPGALPSIFTGLRIALSVAIVVLVISEFVVGDGEGLGDYIQLQQVQFRVPEMYAGIVFLGVLGIVLNQLLLVVEHKVLRWHYGAIGAAGR
jgi:ABC-type nitrate/sulfonate/bicarbonate transport system permease component